jgi:hypothetical protein
LRLCITTNRSVEDAPQIIDSTTPVTRVFITFGGPQAHERLVRAMENVTVFAEPCT